MCSGVCVQSACVCAARVRLCSRCPPRAAVARSLLFILDPVGDGVPRWHAVGIRAPAHQEAGKALRPRDVASRFMCASAQLAAVEPTGDGSAADRARLAAFELCERGELARLLIAGGAADASESGDEGKDDEFFGDVVELLVPLPAGGRD